MKRGVLFLAICALAVALPRNNRSAEYEIDKSEPELSASTTVKPESAASETEEPEVQEPSTTTTEKRESAESETEEPEVQNPSTTTTEKPVSKVINIVSSGDFETQLSQAGDKLVVVFAMTSWCGHSARAAPNVEAISTRADLVVLKVDVDKVTNTPGIDWKYGVTGIGAIPTFFFVRRGVLLEHYSGDGPKKLRRALTKYLVDFSSDSF